MKIFLILIPQTVEGHKHVKGDIQDTKNDIVGLGVMFEVNYITRVTEER